MLAELVRGLNTIQMQLNFRAGILPFQCNWHSFLKLLCRIGVLQNGAHGAKAQYYTNWAVGGADLKPRTVVGMLDTWKMMGRVLRLWAIPYQSPWGRADEYVLMMNGAMRRGTLNPWDD